MIFLFPVPVIVGGAVAYVVGRQAFWQCSDIAKTWTTDQKNAVKDTTVASVVAAAVFLGVYGNALHQLRLLNSARTVHASRSTTNGAAAAASSKVEEIAGHDTKPVVTFKEFMREALPVAVVHSQALAVSVVFSGFAHGATNGYFAENSDEPQDSNNPLDRTHK